MAKEYSHSELQEMMLKLLSIGDKLERWELQFVDEDLMQHEGVFNKIQEDKLVQIYDRHINELKGF